MAWVGIGNIKWYDAWHIARGAWRQRGFDEEEARRYIGRVFAKIEGDPRQKLMESRIRLQQELMSLGGRSFEEVQTEAPFSLRARNNLDALFEAWQREGEEGVAHAWPTLFAPGRLAAPEDQTPISIAGRDGDSAETALQVKGASDRRIRVAAEWWYLFYTFQTEWRATRHSSRGDMRSDVRYSVHDIITRDDEPRTVWFKITAADGRE